MNAERKKLVIILDKSRELTTMASAIGHVCAGLASIVGREELSLVDYRDANDVVYPSISDWPVMILRGGAGQIKNLRDQLIAASLPAVCYLDTMFSGGSEAQQAATRNTSTENVAIVALATFGSVDRLDPYTKKFSLWH